MEKPTNKLLILQNLIMIIFVVIIILNLINTLQAYINIMMELLLILDLHHILLIMKEQKL